MLQLNSIFPIKGTIGDITFYKRNGKIFGRKKSNLDKNKVLNDPRFEGSRKAMNEFSRAAYASKIFCNSLPEQILELANKKIYHAGLSTMFKIIKSSDNIYGNSHICISGFKNILLKIDIQSKNLFKSIFKYNCKTSHNNERTSSSLIIDSFSPCSLIKVPGEATHFRFFNSVLVISDIIYDKFSKSYIPMHPLLNGVNAFEYSEYYDVNDSAKLSLSLTASLDPQLILPQTVSILNIIGFQFYLSENDNMIPVLTNSAVKIAQVF